MKNKASNFLQIYFMGDEDKEVDRRCQIVVGLNENLTLQLQRMFREQNHLMWAFKTALERMPNEKYKIS